MESGRRQTTVDPAGISFATSTAWWKAAPHDPPHKRPLIYLFEHLVSHPSRAEDRPPRVAEGIPGPLGQAPRILEPGIDDDSPLLWVDAEPLWNFANRYTFSIRQYLNIIQKWNHFPIPIYKAMVYSLFNIADIAYMI